MVQSNGLTLVNADRSQLLVVNVQDNLVRAMPKTDRDAMVSNINRLTQTARLLGIPTLLSEHYSQGLGETIPEVRQYLPLTIEAKNKYTFSCCTAPGFEEELEQYKERKQIVIVGLEAHICVLQTAAGLRQWGYQVFVVQDAICSRSAENRSNAIKRMRAGGVSISCAESVAFEWVGNAEHPHFKEISQLFR